MPVIHRHPRLIWVYGLFALWGVGVVFEASRGLWTVSWDDDRTQEFTLGASSTKTRMQFGYPNFLQRPKTLSLSIFLCMGVRGRG